MDDMKKVYDDLIIIKRVLPYLASKVSSNQKTLVFAYVE